jgi:hypothetical protein
MDAARRAAFRRLHQLGEGSCSEVGDKRLPIVVVLEHSRVDLNAIVAAGAERRLDVSLRRNSCLWRMRCVSNRSLDY